MSAATTALLVLKALQGLLVLLVLCSHRQRGEDGVGSVVQLVVGEGGLQVWGLLHSLCREAVLTLLIQSGQLTATATEHTTRTTMTPKQPADRERLLPRTC